MPAKKILIADDSLTIQKVIRLALANEGYEIQSYSEGNEALQQLSIFRPDVVLVDVGLSGKNAFELKEAVSADPDLRNLRFVLMSSAFKSVDEDKAKSLGFDGRLVKPFDPAHLRQVLQNVLSSAVAPPSTPPPAPPISTGSDEDIKMLTESTIKMSGLDDFDAWSVNEPGVGAAAKTPESEFVFEEPKIEPASENFFDLGGTTFESTDAGAPISAPELDFERAPPAANVPSQTTVSSFSDLAKTDFLSLTPKELFNQGAGVDSGDVPPEPITAQSTLEAPSFTDTDPFALPPDLEALVKKHVEAYMKKIASQVVPDLAEKIIKDEIHKLLSNPPR